MLQKHPLRFYFLDWKYTPSEVLYYRHFLTRQNSRTLAEWEEDAIKNFMTKFDFDGLSSSTYFEARSNQVIIEIDGDKLISPYDTKTTRFSGDTQ